MKRILLFITAVSGCWLASAQTQSNWFSLRASDQHTRFINRLLLAQTSSTTPKPTTQQQRVIAQASGDNISTDSVVYKYSGTRGSRFDHNSLGFSYDYSFSSNYAPLMGPFYLPDPMYTLPDSLALYNGNTIVQKSRGFYRSDNKRDSVHTYLYDGANVEYAKTTNSFYPGGYLKENLVQTGPDGINFTPANRRRLTYNNTYTQITSDSTWFDFGAGIQPFQAMSYFYNNQDRPDTIETYTYSNGSFALSQLTAIQYTATGKLQLVRQYNIVNDTLYPVSTDTFGYTGSNPNYSFHELRSFDPSGGLSFGSRQIKYMGSNGQPDSVTLYTSSGMGWNEYSTLKYTYNSFGNPDRISATDGSGSIRFYYELYDDGLAIAPLAQSKAFQLYPNPFRNELYIEWKELPGKTSVSLCNLAGQEVYRNVISLHTGKNTLNIPGLSAGNYILLVRDADGKTRSSKITKE